MKTKLYLLFFHLIYKWFFLLIINLRVYSKVQEDLYCKYGSSGMNQLSYGPYGMTIRASSGGYSDREFLDFPASISQIAKFLNTNEC